MKNFLTKVIRTKFNDNIEIIRFGEDDKINVTFDFKDSEVDKSELILFFFELLKKENLDNKLKLEDIKVIFNSKNVKDVKNEILDVYQAILFLLRKEELKIKRSSFFLEYNKEFEQIEIVVETSKEYNFFLNKFKSINNILKNLSIISSNISLRQDGKYFNKEKLFAKESKKNDPLERKKETNRKVDMIRSVYLNPLDKNEKENVSFKGEIFRVDERKIKNNLTILNYMISGPDRQVIDAVFVGRVDKNFNVHSKGTKVIVSGDWKKDNYSNEFKLKNIRIEKLNEEEEELEIFKNSKPRSELHVHTKMSVMDGVSSVEEYFKKAKEENIKAIAITDHNSVQSFPDLDFAAKKYKDIKPIYGVEFNAYDDSTEIIINPRDEELLRAEYIFFDLETTGISPYLNEIIEFGAVKQVNGSIVERKQMFIKPSKPIPKTITELTSITDEDVKDAKTIEEAIIEIKEWIGDSILVAHNAFFDYSFLNSVYKKNGLGELKNPVIDTLKISWLVNKTLKNHRLGTVARNENQTYDESIAHRADYDAEILQKTYENILYKLFDLGIRNLNQFNDRSSEILANVFDKHINVIAKNKEGLKDLYKLVSKSHIKYFDKKRGLPSLPLSEILNNRENLLIGSSCSNGFLWDDISNDVNHLKDRVKIFDYLEVFPPTSYSHLKRGEKYTDSDLEVMIKKIIELGKENNIPVIASSDAHYSTKSGKIIRDIYITNKSIGGRIHPLFERRNPKQENPDNHLRTASEMEAEFKFLPSDVIQEIVYNNSNKIADSVDNFFSIREGLYPPKIENAEEKFKKLIEDNIERIYGKDVNPVILERVKKEVDSILKHGYGIIYYLSSLAVKKSLEDGFLVGSRGSVGSSIAATLSDITEVNPLEPHYICPKCKHHEFVEGYQSGFDLPDKECPVCKENMRGDGHWIPFETFLGFDGDKVPDIDLNFSRDHQANIHLYVKELLGEENVFRAGTISTVAERTAFGYVKNYIEVTEKEEEFNSARINYFASLAEGTKRTTGQHPGGLIVVPSDMEIYDFTPINFPGNDVNSNWLTTHFDFHSIHDNLLKLDLLGHLDPSSINMLQQLTKVDPLTIPMNDRKVLSLFLSNEALKYVKNYTNDDLGIIGIPEFGTKFVRELVKDAKPKTFSDLVIISGLSHGTDVWLGNAKTLIENNIAKLKDVISVRDDIMTFLINKGLDKFLSFTIMESVRKGKGLKKEWEEEMLKNGVPKWYIESCKKIKYMFPKAHATAYVMMAYRISWYKINYPLEYYATFFTKRDTEWDIDSLYKGVEGILKFKEDFKKATKFELTERDKDINETYEIVLELYSRGLNISKISLEKSKAKEWIIDKENNSLIPPFAILEGLGEAVAQKFVEERERQPFTSYNDFVSRSGVNKTLIQKLEEIGTLDSLERKNKISEKKDSVFDLL